MLRFLSLITLTCLFTLVSCQDAGLMGNIKVSVKETQPKIERVKIENDQLIITGSNLEKVTVAKVEGSTNHSFEIESKSSGKLVLNAKSALNFLVGQTLNLIVSNAQAAATFPITFELQNGQVTASKLHHMGASSGQYLRFNGTTWAPSSISTSQIFAGAYDAATDSPDIVSIGGSSGTYYIVTVAGTQDLGSGSEAFDVGDWVIYNGSTWSRIAVGTNTVSGFNGRTGLVVPLANDYSWSMLTKAAGKLTGSKVSDIADVDVAGIQDGDILQWNAGGSKWEVNSIPFPTIAAGSISNTQLANSAVDSNKIVDGTIVNADVSATAAIAQSKIQNLTTDLGNKEPLLPTGGTTAQYLRGNKTLATLDTAAVPENGNFYFTPARVLSTLITTYATGGTGAIAVTDTVPQALSKLETKTNSLGNYVLRDGTSAMTGALPMGGNKITGLGTPTANTDAATKAYVDSVAGGGGSSQWSTNGTAIHYNSGNVGIGTNTPGSKLHLKATTGDFITFTPDANDGGGTTFDTKYIIRPVQGNDGGGATFNRAGLQFTHEGTDTTGLFSFDGRVGIGRDEPEYPLDVNGVARAGSYYIKSTATTNLILAASAGLASNLTFRFPPTAGSNNQVLTTDGAGNLSWTTPAGGGGGSPTGNAGGDLSGTYPNPTIAALDATKIGAGSVDSTEFSYLDGVTSSIQTQLNAKEAALPTGGTTLQYLRGDKTLATLNTSVVPEQGTNEYFTQGRVRTTPINGYAVGTAIPLATTDTVIEALGKLEAQITAVDTVVDNSGQWLLDGTNTYYGGRVGINNSSPTYSLDLAGSTDAVRLPAGTLAQRPTPAAGVVRFNSDYSTLEFYDGSHWTTLKSKFSPTVFTAATTLTAAQGYQTIRFNSTSNITLTLPSTTGLPEGWWVEVANEHSVRNVSVVPSDSSTIDGLANFLLNRKTWAKIIWLGSSWRSIYTSGSLFQPPAGVTLQIASGKATTGSGMNISLGASSGYEGVGGSVNVTAGSAATQTSATYDGGTVYINGGMGVTNGSGGPINLSGGTGVGTGAGGAVGIFGGSSPTNGGSVAIWGGAGASSVRAPVLIAPDLYGNVGIGTMTPASNVKLDVAGDVKFGYAATACVASNEGSIRYQSAIGHFEYCNGDNWEVLNYNNEALPASVAILMEACPSGWTSSDLPVQGGPASAFCNGTSCKLCAPTGPNPINIPANSNVLMDTCPKGWTKTSTATGPTSVSYKSALFSTCQSPGTSKPLPTGVKVLAQIGMCPGSWSDLGAPDPGSPGYAAGVTVCEVGNKFKDTNLIARPAANSENGSNVVVKASEGGGYIGAGGSLNLYAGNAPSEGIGGSVNISAGSSASFVNNTPTIGGSVIINSAPGAVGGSHGAILLNPTNGYFVGVGTSAPAYKLDVAGTVNISAADSLRFDGTIVCSSSGCTSPSDRRLKKEVHLLQDSLLKITQLQGVAYYYIDAKKFGKQHQVGVIAQDVEKVFPEVVKTDAKTGFKSVAYDHLVAPIIEAIKELHQKVLALFSTSEKHSRKIASLEAENVKLKAKTEQVERENAAIKAYLCKQDPNAPLCP